MPTSRHKVGTKHRSSLKHINISKNSENRVDLQQPPMVSNDLYRPLTHNDNMNPTYLSLEVSNFGMIQAELQNPSQALIAYFMNDL